MIGRLHHPRAWKAAFFTVLLLGLVLGACDHGSIPGEDEAQAQQPADQRRVRTFLIEPETFDLFPDTGEADLSVTDITIRDQVTEYRIPGNHNLRFTPSGGTQVTVSLDPGDRVYERPASGLLTVFTQGRNFTIAGL